MSEKKRKMKGRDIRMKRRRKKDRPVLETERNHNMLTVIRKTQEMDEQKGNEERERKRERKA